jgi:hypothetical protein
MPRPLQLAKQMLVSGRVEDASRVAAAVCGGMVGQEHTAARTNQVCVCVCVGVCRTALRCGQTDGHLACQVSLPSTRPHPQTTLQGAVERVACLNILGLGLYMQVCVCVCARVRVLGRRWECRCLGVRP